MNSGAAPSTWRTALAMALNFVVSVAIVSVNKLVYLGGFRSAADDLREVHFVILKVLPPSLYSAS